MKRRYWLFWPGLLALFSFVSVLPAQDEPPKPPPPKPERTGDYRDYFKKPENTLEFWNAMQFEIEVGRYDLAAKHLRGMLETAPNERTLVAIANRERVTKNPNKEGLSAFIELRNISKWSDVPKEQAQAKEDVKKLIELATQALRKNLSAEENVTKYIRNLSGEPERREFAVNQLHRIGPDAMPYLIDALIKAGDEDRANILFALERMGKDSMPPLLAALDVEDPKVKLQLLDILEKRADPAAIPWLWYLGDSKKQPDFIRNRARDVLAVLLQTDKSLLPPAKEMLTKEAEQYYQGKVRFPDPEFGDVTVWRWDNGRLRAGWDGFAVVKKTKAEEYYGLRFAGQALDLDPEYKPAQVVFLSLALEKAIDRAGLDKPLLAVEPQVHDLLTRVNPELVTTVLERALADQNLPVILGATRALGELAEVGAARPHAGGDAALIKALYYPNRRVCFAAAESLLRLPRLPIPDEPRKPGVTPTLPQSRIVEVLRRAVAVEPVPAAAKVLVIHNNVEFLAEIEKRLKAEGFDPVTVRTGRDGLRRLNQASDIDAIFVDSNVPDPLLPHFLGQVRSDVNAGLLPVFVMLPAYTREGIIQEWDRLTRELKSYRLKALTIPDLRKKLEVIDNDLQLADGEAADKLKVQKAKIEEELKAFAPDTEKKILDQLKQLEAASLAAQPDPELRLRSMTNRYRNVEIIPASFATNSEFLKKVLKETITAAIGKPLSEMELNEYAELSLLRLAELAQGGKKGFDIRPAGDTVIQALQNNKFSPLAQTNAVRIAGRLPGEKSQVALAGVVVEPNRDPFVRFVAAQTLTQHIQDFGGAVPVNLVKALVDVYSAADTDPRLRGQIAVVLGSLRPNAQVTGNILKGFQIPPPVAPPMPMPMPPPKDDK